MISANPNDVSLPANVFILQFFSADFLLFLGSAEWLHVHLPNSLYNRMKLRKFALNVYVSSLLRRRGRFTPGWGLCCLWP